MTPTLPLPLETVIIISLGTALVLALLIILVINKGRRAARRDCAAARAELDRIEKQTPTLRTEVQALDPHTSLNEFEPDKLYTLLACGDFILDGKTMHYGVVRDESGNACPFLTHQAVQNIEVQDTFTTVRGKLAKIVEDSFTHEVPGGKKPNTKSIPSNTDTATQKPVTAARFTTARKRPDTKEPATLVSSSLSGMPSGEITKLHEVPSTDDTGDKTVLYLESREPAQLERDRKKGLTFLKVLEGKDKNSVFYLPFGKTTIGRQNSCTVVLKDSGCSHIHSVLEYIDIGFVLQDNKSTNGTFCNGSRVTDKILEFGDLITVGDTTLLFSCEGFELKDNQPQEAIDALEQCLKHQPEFLAALKNLAFLLERDIARTKEAQPLWDKIIKLEKRG